MSPSGRAGRPRAAATRTLVVAPQWIGDAVMSEPLLRRLADGGAALTVAALPWVAPVYRAIPQVDEVIEWPFAHGRPDLRARWREARRLHGRFDAAVVLPNSAKSALIPWLAGIPRRIGYLGENRYGLLNERTSNPAGRPPMVAFYAALAGDPGPAVLASATASDNETHSAVRADVPRLHLPAERLDAALARAQLARGGYWAFAPGAEYGPAKRWPATHYAALARSLATAHGLPVVLLGSAKERALCDEIAALADGACRVLAGTIPMEDAMALIAGARGVVSNDSGLMHVAAAFGVPQVAVFGSTSPEHTPPANLRARVLWLKDELRLDCAPCFERVCRFEHTRCLTGVPAARVEAALQEAVGTLDG